MLAHLKEFVRRLWPKCESEERDSERTPTVGGFLRWQRGMDYKRSQAEKNLRAARIKSLVEKARSGGAL